MTTTEQVRQVVQCLREARAKIDATGFARGYEARDTDGTAVGFDSESAHCYCPAFAVVASAPPSEHGDGHPAWWGSVTHAALAALWAGVTSNPLSHTALYDGAEIIEFLAGWSDQLRITDADVLGAFDRALAAAERWAIDHEHAVLRHLARYGEARV